MKTLEAQNLYLQSLLRARDSYEGKLLNANIEYQAQKNLEIYLKDQISRLDSQIQSTLVNIERIEMLLREGVKNV